MTESSHLHGARYLQSFMLFRIMTLFSTKKLIFKFLMKEIIIEIKRSLNTKELIVTSKITEYLFLNDVR